MFISWSEERERSSAEEEEEERKSGDEYDSKKKKKKKRKKKKKHKRKKSGRCSESSGSDSETVYPSDLKKEQEAERCKQTRPFVLTPFMKTTADCWPLTFWAVVHYFIVSDQQVLH